MSEKIESHEKLVECGVLDLMVTILKETKHPKLYRQVILLNFTSVFIFPPGMSIYGKFKLECEISTDSS